MEWDKECYFIRCIQLKNMPEEEKCGIYQIDHEELFDFNEDTVTSDEIDQCMKFVSENLSPVSRVLQAPQHFLQILI